MRLGIFGGSFDPIHQGHLILAEQCRELAKLDQVWFLPCATSPHKTDGANTTDRQRSEMIELALAGHDGFSLCKLELERGGISYTVDTLQEIHDAHPDAELFLMMGDDSLERFASWKEPAKICQLATPLVVNRPGSGEVDLSVLKTLVDDTKYEKIKSMTMTSPMIEISSSDIREKRKTGRSLRYLMPRSVQRYIESQGLYGGEKT